MSQKPEQLINKSRFDKREQFFTKLNIKRIKKKINPKSIYIDPSKFDSIVYLILIVEQILFKVK